MLAKLDWGEASSMLACSIGVPLSEPRRSSHPDQTRRRLARAA
jgi:hypothetical protein